MGLFDSIGDAVGSVTGKIGSAVGGVTSKIGSILDPSGARLSAAQLLQGGAKAFGAPGSYQQQNLSRQGIKINLSDQANNGYATGAAGTGGMPAVSRDWRVRVSASNSVLYNYNPGVMAPLIQTAGVVFPVTPSVTTTYTANYSPQKLTHSNQPAYFYDSSEMQAIQISGDFPVQNDQDAAYLLAAMYFFKASTKMFFGQSDLAGNPPPIVFLDGYGPDIFDHISCVVTSFQHVLPNEVDYYDYQLTRLPTMSQLQVSLQPVLSRAKAGQFNLDDFAAGNMIGQGFF